MNNVPTSGVDNPYAAPASKSTVAHTEPSGFHDHSLAIVRASLISFGIVGFLAPICFLQTTDRLYVDAFALIASSVGMLFGRRSFRSLTPTALFLLLASSWPLRLITRCTSEFVDLGDHSHWIAINRSSFGSPCPLVFETFLALWSLVNIVLVFHFYLSRKQTGKPKAPG